MKKVVLVTPFDPRRNLGGVERFVNELSSHLREFKVALVSGGKNIFPKQFKIINSVTPAYNLLLTHGDLFHYQGWIGWLAELKKPSLTTFHGTAAGVYHATKEFRSRFQEAYYKLVNIPLEHLACKNSEMAVAVSEQVRQEVIQYYKTDEQKIRVIHNGVDVHHFSPPATAEHDKGIIVSGRIDVPTKGFDFIQKLAKDHPIHIAGFAPGTVPGITVKTYTFAEMPSVLSDYSVFVQTSRYEGFSIALLEAMACEVPPIVFDRGGASEAIRDGKDGFVIPFGDITKMKERIDLLLEDENLRRRMGRSARKRVIENFSLEKMVSEYVSLYNELLE